MKRNDILNGELSKAVAGVGHTQYLVLCDAGLPIPTGVKMIDLSLVKGKPSLMEVLKAVSEEMVIESFIVASELEMVNSKFLGEIQEVLKGISYRTVEHEKFKELTKSSYTIVRTGECSSYANLILVGGVNF
ncbi:MAG TPA: D-ribose pyranase [Candidatus Blautia avistercoris]|nr:D-ribose pyranase [Candidatus Blautia avistercoris]